MQEVFPIDDPSVMQSPAKVNLSKQNTSENHKKESNSKQREREGSSKKVNEIESEHSDSKSQASSIHETEPSPHQLKQENMFK